MLSLLEVGKGFEKTWIEINLVVLCYRYSSILHVLSFFMSFESSPISLAPHLLSETEQAA